MIHSACSIGSGECRRVVLALLAFASCAMAPAALAQSICGEGSACAGRAVDDLKLVKEAFAAGVDTLTTNRAKFINGVLTR